jgi:hypothetical protein
MDHVDGWQFDDGRCEPWITLRAMDHVAGPTRLTGSARRKRASWLALLIAATDEIDG